MAPTTDDVDQPPHQQDNWGPQDEQHMGPGGGAEPPNGASLPPDDDRALGQGPENPDYPRGSSAGAVSATEGKEITFREKQIKVLRSLVSCLFCDILHRLAHYHAWYSTPS